MSTSPFPKTSVDQVANIISNQNPDLEDDQGDLLADTFLTACSKIRWGTFDASNDDELIGELAAQILTAFSDIPEPPPPAA